MYWLLNAWDSFRDTFPFIRHDLTPPGTDAKYLIRWTLWRGLHGRALYLHHIVASDWAREPHDHPKTFTSIGLWGSYIEETYQFDYCAWRLALTNVREFKAPWVRQFPANHIHRLMVDKPCWTLVYVGEREQNWGFFSKNGKMLFADYMRENFG